MSAAQAPVWVKVCGLRTREALDAAVAAGADAVGFVFHAPSPRHLDVAAARALAQAVPRHVAKVAVFLHPAQSLVDAALAAVQPDYVQTDAADLAALRLPAGQRVLPVFRTTAVLPADLPAHLLLEGGTSGAGERIDWSAAAAVAARTRVVLAGGLDPSNVADAVAAVRPWGVDVSSGVESARGVKDAALIRQFVAAAKPGVSTR